MHLFSRHFCHSSYGLLRGTLDANLKLILKSEKVNFPPFYVVVSRHFSSFPLFVVHRRPPQHRDADDGDVDRLPHQSPTMTMANHTHAW
jgi:hypothetical protein